MDGARGYARLKEERFDLILTDIRMPEVNGFEILAGRAHARAGTPVIAMSGSAEIPDAVRAMHAGARDFLIKPFEVRTLEEAVAAVLKPTPPNEPETDALAWRDELRRRCWAATRRCCPRCRCWRRWPMRAAPY
jgi:DNA-binding NtrC family response regulator